MHFAAQVAEDDPSLLVTAPAQKKTKTKHYSLAHVSDDNDISMPEES